MTAEEKLKEPRHIRVAVEDWKNGLITRDRLFNIFNVNLFVGYGYLGLDDRNKSTSEIRNLLSEAIKETVMVEHRPNS